MDFYLNHQKLLLIILAIILAPLVVVFILTGTNLIPTSKKPPQKLQVKGTFICPALKQFCQLGQTITGDEGQYLGFGAIIPAQSQIKAVFDGKVTKFTTFLPKSPTAPKEDVQTIYLDNAQENLRAIYFFKGKLLSGDNISKAQAIGISEDKINRFNTSLLFQIIKGDPAKNQPLILKSADFSL